MLASSYPLLNVFWTMLIFFGFFIWIWLLIMVFGDIFRSHDIGGFAKALWVLFVIIVPLFGLLIYLIARGHGMADRNVTQAQQQQHAFDDYVRETDASSSPADQLTQLAALHDQGKLSDADFDRAKAKVIS